MLFSLAATLSAQGLISQATQVENANSTALLPTFVQFEAGKMPTFSEKPSFISRFVRSEERRCRERV